MLFAIGMAALLMGCNSTDSTLGIGGSSGQQAQVTPDPAAATAPATPALQPSAPQVATVQTGEVRLRFAPIIGAPVEKVTALSRRFSARAREQKVAIVASTDQTATHVLKGYFSVLGEGANTTVVYVFDVLDPAGNRLHRIQGQETVPSSNSADPWAAVPANTLELIADKAMAEFAAWRKTQA
ncbi:MAG: hypothetical protein WCC66_01335 [Rhizobiaceae bacterium]